MKIEVYDEEISSELMALLLTADPDRDAVLNYIECCKMLVCEDGGKVVGVAVLLQAHQIAELKNIAVLEKHQGKGIAKAMISQAKQLAKTSGAQIIEVGTGNSSLSQLALYQKCGFRMHSIEPGFFEHYPEPIFENGIRCTDMIKLRAEL